MTHDRTPAQRTLRESEAALLDALRDAGADVRRPNSIRCPFHDDGNASAGIFRDDSNVVRFKCHGCNVSGDLFDIRAKVSGRSVAEELAEARDADLPRVNLNGFMNQDQTGATYSYVSADGELLFEVVRRPGKKFLQRMLDGNGGYVWNLRALQGQPRPLYRLPELMNAPADAPVFLVEGEKDVDRLCEEGLSATTTVGGSGKSHLSDLEPLHGRHVIIVADNDTPGRKHARQIADALHGKAASVRILALPDHWPACPVGGDISDWLDAGHNVQQLQALAEGQAEYEPAEAEVEDADDDVVPAILSFADLREQFPKLREPVVHGIIRPGEIGNIAAQTKSGKSWLAYSLGLSVATGRLWLDGFACNPGHVLLIDNELHRESLSNRIPRVAEAMGISQSEYQSRIDILSLRGHDVTMDQLPTILHKVERGQYALITVDAWYRTLPSGMSENSNADIMKLYNTLDRIAGQLDAAIVVIHHTSKGNQSDKTVTDVGSGAGAQSRAADSHLVIRQHDEDGCAVIDFALRSFAPIPPIGLRWDFPLWRRDDTLNPEQLKGRKTQGEARQERRDDEGRGVIRAVLADGPMTHTQLRNATGISVDRIKRLIGQLHAAGEVIQSPVNVNGNETNEYSLAQN